MIVPLGLKKNKDTVNPSAEIINIINNFPIYQFSKRIVQKGKMYDADVVVYS